MSATWAWSTVTPWSSRAAQVALITEQECRQEGFRLAGEETWAGSTEEVGPWLPKISSWRKCRGNTFSFPTTKLPPVPWPHFPRAAEDSVWWGQSSSLDRKAGVRSGLTKSLKTDGTHAPKPPPLKDLSCLQALCREVDQCCSQSEPLPGNRVRRKGRDKGGLRSTSRGLLAPLRDIQGQEGASAYNPWLEEGNGLKRHIRQTRVGPGLLELLSALQGPVSGHRQPWTWERGMGATGAAFSLSWKSVVSWWARL